MKRVQFNVNQYVYVKLTQHGLDLLKEQNDTFWASIGRSGPEYVPPKLTPDGYHEFQLWEFMEKFGHLYHLSADLPHYFETGTVLEFDEAAMERKEPH